MEASALTEGLTPDQRAAVTSEAAPLCVIAGAGAGKTAVLTRRIAYRAGRGSLDPSHALALTFTRKAAGELRRRLRDLGVDGPIGAGTFHGVALAQLRRRWADQGRRPAAILADPRRLLEPIVAAAGRSSSAVAAREIAWARARLVVPSEYPTAAASARRRVSIPPQVLASVYARYEEEKRRRRLLDLDDVIAACTRALETDREFAEAQRWRWRHLFVDEYQDLNPAHARLLDAWLGDRLDLCVAGDPHQAIYGWNGADPTLLSEFAVRYPTAGRIMLDANFRSSAEIVTVAEAALGRPAARSVPETAAGPMPTVASYPTDADEALAIARTVRDRHAPGTAWSRIAVLARTNAQLDGLARALETAGIPARVQGGRPITKLAAVRPLLDAAAGDGPARTLVTDARMILGTEASSERVAELDCLLQALDEYLDLDPAGTVGGLRQWLDAGDRTHDGPAGDAVVLSSFHRAKGLEWPIVFVAGLEEGLVPLADHGPALAEERRLLYVALTRARTELHCSWARRRVLDGRLARRQPSRWLAAIEDAVIRLGNERRPVDGRPHLRAIRRQLAGLAASG